MLTKSLVHDETLGNPLATRRPLQLEVAHELPAVPVMPETLLLMELMAQEPCVDLRELSQLVLADVGATLQIYRLAGREYGRVEGRPLRMADCIADLGLEACMNAVTSQAATFEGRDPAIAEFWAHSLEIAQSSKRAAEDTPDVNPEEAYLIGLLHGIGYLPSLLEWRESGVADGALSGLRLAKRWLLPQCVTEFFCEFQLTGYVTRWLGVVRKAHCHSKRPSMNCIFEESMRPRLHKRG